MAWARPAKLGSSADLRPTCHRVRRFHHPSTAAAHLDAQVSQNEIRTALESNDEDAKVEAMQKAITAILAGEQFPALFITIVRYVLPSENHMVQKLLLLYLVSPAALPGQHCSSARIALQHALKGMLRTGCCSGCGRPSLAPPSARPAAPPSSRAAGNH